MPDGAVGWWRGEGDNVDSLGNGSTAIPGGAAFASGFVGQAFSFSGGAPGVVVGDPTAFQLQNFTIEAWIKRADPNLVSQAYGAAVLFAGGKGSYSLAMQGTGELLLGQVTVSNVASSARIADTNWHHVAVTLGGTNVTFYIDGNPAGSAIYQAFFYFDTPFAIGSLGTSGYTFWGLIDEPTLYKRPLSALEIGAIYRAGSAGKSIENIALGVSTPSVVRVGTEFKARFSMENQGPHPVTNALLNVSLPDGFTLVTNESSLGTNVLGTASVQNLVATLQPKETVTVTLTGHGEVPAALGFHAQISRDGAPPTSLDDSADPVVSVVGPGANLPDGIVGWWRAEGDNLDAIGNGSAAVPGGAGFVRGVVGQAFNFAGNSPGVVVGSPNAFQVEDFTIEAWIKRADLAAAAQSAPAGVIFGGGQKSYGLLLQATGELALSQVGIRQVSGSGRIMDTDWHHVAVAKAGTNVEFYIDGLNAGSAGFDAAFGGSPAFAVGALGAPVGNNNYYTFWGAIDETSLYNRALSGVEIRGIYAAGAAGKSFENIALAISAPTTALPGGNFTVSFSVFNGGFDVASNVVLVAPFPTGFTLASSSITQGSRDVAGPSVQASFGSLLPGDTATFTMVGAVATSGAAVFTGQVTRDGTELSLLDNQAEASVEILRSCAPVTEGLLAWFPAEGMADDVLSHPIGLTNLGYAPGRVGQAFSFNGASEVAVPDSGDLTPTQFTIETWVYPTALDGGVDSIANKLSFTNYSVPEPEVVRTVGYLQFALGIKGPRNFAASKIPQGDLAFSLGGITGLPDDYGGWTDAHAALPLNQWSHVALTLTSDTATAYLNGAVTLRITGLTGSLAVNGAPLRIGSVPPSTGRYAALPEDYFNGRIDEFSYYSRALTETEVAAIYLAGGAGKCAPSIAPTILVAPLNQTLSAGQDAIFGVVASGTGPFAYQWKFKGVDIAGATNSSLIVPAVRQSAVGTYAVSVCNSAGCASLATATLTVNPIPTIVSVVNVTASALQNIEVPLRLIGNGVENTFSFTLRFDTNRLTYAATDLGTDAADGQLLVNEAQAAQGVLGISLALPSGSAFSNETNEVLRLKFDTAAVSGDVTVPLSLVSGITPEKLLDTNGVALPATWVDGTVTIKAINFEADVSPLPGGDRLLDISDWTQVGRYVAGLDDLSPGVTFQRADCAPLVTAGNGVLSVSDWVQAGRFAVGLDLPVAVGGPTNPQPFISAPTSPTRVVRLAGMALIPGQTGEIPVTLTASGDENAVGFSLSYDPAVLTFVGAVKGADSQKASLNVNTRQAAGGQAAVTLALNPGSKFPAGALEIARLQFKAIGGGSASADIAFADVPVGREVASPLAEVLPVSWQGVSLGVTLPSVNVRRIATADGPAIELSWPASLTGAALETTDSLGGTWAAVTGTPTVVEGQNTVVLPLSAAAAYFHLKLP